MSYFVVKPDSLVFWNLKWLNAAHQKLTYPLTSALGYLDMLIAILLLLFANLAWLLAFSLLPMLLICVWISFRTLDLYRFLKGRIIGKNFLV